MRQSPTIQAMVRRLRRRVPLRRPVQVEIAGGLVSDGDRVLGECEFDGHRFHIRVLAGMRQYLTEEALMHEWAHALAWHKGGPSHGAAWGRAYARVYRAIRGED